MFPGPAHGVPCPWGAWAPRRGRLGQGQGGCAVGGVGCTGGEAAFLSHGWSLSVWGWEVAWDQLSPSLPQAAPAVPALAQECPCKLSCTDPGPRGNFLPAPGGTERWAGCSDTPEFGNRQMQKVCRGAFPSQPPAFSLCSAPRLPPALSPCVCPGQRPSARPPVCPLHPLPTPGLRPQHPRALLAQLSSNV